MNTIKQTDFNYEELRKSLEKSIFVAISRLGNKAAELDWFAGNKERSQSKKAA